MSLMCAFIEGCTQVDACNYNADAQLDDGSCTFLDLCGNCVEAGNTDCDQDCNGVWGGDAAIDGCNVCGGTFGISSCCAITDINTCIDCPSCYWDQQVGGCFENVAGNCDGAGLNPGSGSSPCCGDEGCGYCNCDGDVKDCLGVCGGTAVIDDCGVCNGNNESADCFGFCPQEGAIFHVEDNCGVCDGNNESCSGSIFITGWDIWWDNTTWGFGHEESNDVLLNCPELDYSGNPTNCIDSNIDLLGHTNHGRKLDIKVRVAGDALDYDDDGDVDYNIAITFGIYINRIVEINGEYSDCDSIYGQVYSPITLDGVFKASDADNGDMVFNFTPMDGQLPNLFTNVDIGGNTYSLNSGQDFNAVYNIEIYIKEFNIYSPSGVPAFEYSTDNIVVNDINNKIEANFNIHHNPYMGCAGDLGDASGLEGVNCHDYYLAYTWMLGTLQNCNSFLINPNAPSGCCNVGMLTPPHDVLTWDDLDFLQQMLLDSNMSC